MKKPLIIAHRGASASAPENTLAAFRQAIEDGAEGIEFDVRLSKDGVPVVFHDDDLKRVAQREGFISDFTAEELQNFDVGSWFNLKNSRFANERFSAETVPTFGQVLEFLRDFRGLVYVELKCDKLNVKSLVQAVCREIKASPLFSRIIVKSFFLPAVSETRRASADVQTAALFAPKIVTVLGNKRDFFKLARQAGARQLSLHYSLVTRKLAEIAARENFPVTIWTADNPLWVKRALNLGIAAIITNNPARLLAKRREILEKNLIPLN